MESDISISQNASAKPIKYVAEQLGIAENYLELYGNHKAKICSSLWPQIQNNSDAKLILVTAINPTAAGEGKTTITIGLADTLRRLGHKSCLALREPSLGPCFGLKGGATGGGYAQVIPMEEINLHFTGDIHAIASAHNLLAAIIDNHMHHGNELNFDPKRIVWKRVVDLNDRALRSVIVGLGNKSNGIVRESGFDIAVASEIMAILCLSQDLADLRSRIDKIIVGYDVHDKIINCGKLNVTGALVALLKDALRPNLVQTLEGTPALIHGGPFANIAHGCNSLMATKYALKLADYVVTEAGFGADLGAEKFLDVKCPLLKKNPDLVIIVATIRAIKLHATDKKNALSSGFVNLQKHIENMQHYNLPLIVVLNEFSSDTPQEIEYVRHQCNALGVKLAVSRVWQHGSEGGIEMAEAVLDIMHTSSGLDSSNFNPLYSAHDSVFEKIHKLATVIYGASDVSYSPQARAVLNAVAEDDEAKFYPICMAKTQYSLGDDKNMLGRPHGFNITIRDAQIMAGAGFVVTYAGDIVTMPGLPKHPAAELIDVHDEKITGLS
ncbi:MAG: formate--tetrahydrofolate ligase [Holosporaceae bacterium]|jgi:formate--tetrahydrofolate ligase|nr:formate--tetrahydrofolate ligase [Holosporaceae bacterium]